MSACGLKLDAPSHVLKVRELLADVRLHANAERLPKPDPIALTGCSLPEAVCRGQAAYRETRGGGREQIFQLPPEEAG